MTAISTPFGSFEIRPTDVITMPDGLPGFEGCRRFVVISSPAIQPLASLQGLDDPAPSFVAVDPSLVDPAFARGLTDTDRRLLGIERDDTTLWLAIVRFDDGDKAYVNLRAPVVISPRTMRGIQLIVEDEHYPLDLPLDVTPRDARHHA